eukprot:TRINITY_DN1847_c0_g1_i1.p1 TRINITY_DN1847_c0_g1~~TRINITY_DN1847_c0_g1_i1.p1  ORF type:complete len:340 (-),score=72.91 TRINITY_DN1847_c0_g1_i1:82-1101(-)
MCIRDRHGCKTQIVRSASTWSLGLPPDMTENSIQFSYVESIMKAKHYVYIENQFFISDVAGPEVTNKIVNALVVRLQLAIETKQNFKVVIMIPVLPAFEGNIFDKQAAAVARIQVYWEQMTIFKSKTSLIKSLQSILGNEDDVWNYLMIGSLRTHAKLSDEPVTEMIYIHSKLLIVDDEIAVCGSANLNDRSMDGARDSELCIVVEDDEKVASRLNGIEVNAGKCVYELRKKIFAEHFGLPENEVEDILDDNIWKRMHGIMKRNTEIYREIFAVVPDNEVKSAAQYEEFKKKANKDKYDELVPEIVGHAVQYPYEFLIEDRLLFPISNPGYYLPAAAFT